MDSDLTNLLKTSKAGLSEVASATRQEIGNQKWSDVLLNIPFRELFKLPNWLASSSLLVWCTLSTSLHSKLPSGTDTCADVVMLPLAVTKWPTWL